MPPRAARRLPGVIFESRAPRLPEVLPRMDVAAFVGFASRGPLDVPVPISDAAAFLDLFGPDVELAWDRERSEPLRAQLGPAVRAFFRNGGTRCWVVRVAGSAARENHYPVPGVLQLGPAGFRQAFVVARASGAWSDALRVGAVANRQPASLAQGRNPDGTPAAPLVFEGPQLVAARLAALDTIAAGDVLRLSWPDAGLSAFAAVGEVDAQGGIARFVRDSVVWLAPEAPPDDGWSASWTPTQQGEVPAELAQEPAWSADGKAVALVIGREAPAPGQFLALRRGPLRVWMLVESVRGVELASSPVTPGTRLEGRWFRPSNQPPSALPSAPPACERVRLELWTREGEGHPRRLSALGLAPGHPRYAGALPSDERLFARDDELLGSDEAALLTRVRALAGDGSSLRDYHGELWQEVASPRFPLASDARAVVYLPLLTSVLPDVYLGRAPSAGDAAERDGLARFAAEAFIDGALANESTRSLPEQADFVRWQHPSPRRLTGIHALWDVDEVSIIAAPDAVQRGWSTETEAPPQFLATPVLVAHALPDRTRLTWAALDPGASYVLQASACCTFTDPEVHTLPAGTLSFDVPSSAAPRLSFRLRAYLPATGAAELVGSFWSDPVVVLTPAPQFADCPPGQLGAPQFGAAPEPDASGSYTLGWSEVPHALRYRLEESSELDFAGAESVYYGPAQKATLYGRAPGRYHYRVRAEAGEAALGPVSIVSDREAIVELAEVASPRHVILARYPGTEGEETVFDGEAFSERFAAASRRTALAGGFRYQLVRDDAWPSVVDAPTFRAFVPESAGAWSAGLAIGVLPAPRRIAVAPRQYAPSILLAVQAALAKLAAARGDVLAVLALPEHYRENDAVRHVAALRAALPEPDAWSYGALYHPWLLSEHDEQLLRSPPEGAACGLIAARAAARGAWVAPANQPLGDVLGLSPQIPREQWQRLYESQVNLIWQEPQGFVTLAADTLSLDRDLTPINVRRLLSLLRRVALRAGPVFTFEPNNAVFRRAVERHFEALLDGMYRAGAFAGRTRADAFQVVVDSTQSLDADQGRFRVDLRVAPSLPLSFLTVRLVQNGAQASVSEGA